MRAFALAAAVVLESNAAGAKPPLPVPIERYGRQTLSADAVAAGLTAGGVVVLLASKDSYDAAANTFGWAHVTIGVLTYGVAAPIIHLAHRNAKGAGLSVLLRATIPVGVGIMGLAIADAFVAKCPEGLTLDADSACSADRMNKLGTGALIGAGVGGVVASLIDATALARHYAGAGAQTWTVVPTWHAAGAGLSVAAAF